jgi:hypothetical protein
MIGTKKLKANLKNETDQNNNNGIQHISISSDICGLSNK